MAVYIEREALLNRLNDFCEINCCYTKKQRNSMCGACGIGEAKIMVENTPVANVIPATECEKCLFNWLKQEAKEGE